MWLKDKVGYTFLMVLIIFFILGIVSEPAIAQEIEVYAKIESFTWKEYEDGSRLLKESGPIYGIGTASKLYLYKPLTLKAKVEFFVGQVDYDGQTIAGNPFNTDTNYVGYKIEGDLGWKFMPSVNSSIEPFAGLGYRWWKRDIESITGVIGYTEEWKNLYARLGVRGDYKISKDWKTFAEAGVKLPMYNSNEIELLDVTVKPGKRTSVFAEVGTKYSLFKASAFYEGIRFSKSAPVGVFGIYQPKSKADIFGVNVGVAFELL